MFIDGVEDDQRRVPGNLKLGVSYGRSMIHHHNNVFGLWTDCRDVHWSTRTSKKINYRCRVIFGDGQYPCRINIPKPHILYINSNK